jgi:hypothetical protein
MASRVLKTGENQITQKYGNGHNGVDVVKYKSQLDTIIAHSDGKVIFCQTGHKNNKGAKGTASWGNCVKLDHGDGYCTLYAHLATVSVKNGETVKQGQKIGTMGNTGNSYGAHLHFEVYKGNTRIDPTAYLEADLPTVQNDDTIHVTYKAYTNKWLPEVVDCNDDNTDGYAGIQGKNMTALMAKPTKGTLKYRVHLVGKSWLPWVTNYTDYAGIHGKNIDAVQMQLVGVEGYEVQYRVSPSANKGWYGWCTGLTNATGDGYAGVFGKPIDCIQIKIVKK